VRQAGLLQYRYLTSAEDDRQLVRKSFLLSHCDYTILFFFCLVHHLHCLPEGYMTIIILSEDTIKKPRASKESDVASVQGCEGTACGRYGLSK